MRTLLLIISSIYIFLFIFNSFPSTFSSFQLNLVKVSMMHLLWYHRFHQVLFDIPKTEDAISLLLTSLELHLNSLFTEMNAIATPKSCVNRLPARNESKATLFHLYLKKLPRKTIGCFFKQKNVFITTSFKCMKF